MNKEETDARFAAHRRAQLRRALRLTYAEHLRWLEETMEAFRQWKGSARSAERGPGRETPK